MKFEYKNGEEHVLNEVYYIPNLCNNIISICQLSEEGNKVWIKGEFLQVFDKHERLLMKIRRSTNRLYKIIIENRKSVCLSIEALASSSWTCELSSYGINV